MIAAQILANINITDAHAGADIIHNRSSQRINTASQLQDFLVAALARSVGGSQRRWRIVLGPIAIRDLATHPHCNWTVTPNGSAREVAEIEQLLDTVRLDHPIVISN